MGEYWAVAWENWLINKGIAGNMHYLANCINFNQMRATSARILLGSASPYIQVLISSVGNGSNQLEWFQVRVGTGTEPCQWFLHMKNPDRWHLGQFPPQNLAFESPDISLQSSIWVLIVSWHDVYADCAVLAALSPTAFRFTIRPIFVESLSKTREFRLKSMLISQPLTEYLSDRKFESGRWKSG